MMGKMVKGISVIVGYGGWVPFPIVLLPYLMTGDIRM